MSTVSERSLAEKLDELFSTVHPIGKEYSYNDVARGVEELGAPKVSATYIWQLRTGKRDNPTRRHIEALAAFFGVPPAYFFDDQVAAQVRSQLQLLATLRDRGVRQVATRAAGLSPRALRAVDEMIKQVRQLDECGHVKDVPTYLTCRGRCEVEAESVAYVVAAAYGLDASGYTFAYVAGWAGGDLTRARGAPIALRRCPERPEDRLPAPR